jgi:hypothetical protein
LGVRETGVICSVFHAPTEAALKISRRSPSPVSTHFYLLFHFCSYPAGSLTLDRSPKI